MYYVMFKQVNNDYIVVPSSSVSMYMSKGYKIIYQGTQAECNNYKYTQTVVPTALPNTTTNTVPYFKYIIFIGLILLVWFFWSKIK